MNNKVKTRESNIELYRIFLMLLIIAHHYVIHPGLDTIIYNDFFSFKSVYIAIFGAFGKIGINCFVLITGYFMCESNINLKKFTKLLLEIEFYKIIIFVILCLTGNDSFTIMNFARSVLPVTFITNNFTSCYLLFYLFIPFINILIKNIKRKQHLTLIIMLLFIYSILGSIPSFILKFNYISFFIFIYLIGAYIRKYKILVLENRKKCMIINIVLMFLSISSIILGMLAFEKYNMKIMYFFVNDSNKILAVFLAISIFYLFKNMKIKYNKYINQIALSIFGVLLIHNDNKSMRILLWNKIFKVVDTYNKSFIYVFMHSILSVLIIFIICVIIDQIRIKFIEKPLFNKISDKLDLLELKIKKKVVD